MAIGVDTSKWKPKQLRGTPANKSSTKIALGIISAGVAIGLFLQFSSLTADLRKRFERVYTDPIEVVERKILIGNAMPVHLYNKIKANRDAVESDDSTSQK